MSYKFRKAQHNLKVCHRPRVCVAYMHTILVQTRKCVIVLLEFEYRSAVLMIRVEICPDITLSSKNTLTFSLIMYNKCVRSNLF